MGWGNKTKHSLLDFLQKARQTAEHKYDKAGLKGVCFPSNVHFFNKLAFGRGFCGTARRKCS
jgi:hypothetical protein